MSLLTKAVAPFLFSIALAPMAHAAPAPSLSNVGPGVGSGSSSLPPSSSGTSMGTSTSSRPTSGIGRFLGLSYMSFFNGPALNGDFWKSPGATGRPSDLGWTLNNNASVKYKFSQNYAFDVQFRFQGVLSNQFGARWQGARVGISGLLGRIEAQSFQLIWTGAVNTDVPGMGQINQDRTVIMNPGLFSNLTVRPRGSRWSLYTFLSPRVFLYRDNLAMEPQAAMMGMNPGDKPQIAFFAIPSVNYDISENTALRSGITINISKNANSSSFRRWFAPIDFGISHKFNQALSIYPNVSVSGPWDDGIRQDMAARRGSSVMDWTKTASVGLWLSGTIL